MESPQSDPVVAEIPVFLSKSLEGLLHVFSFPLRRSNRPYEMNDVALEVTELNPSSSNTSDNANDPRSLGLISKSNSSSSSHPNSDQVVIGVRPKFTLQCGFDISGAVGASFTGRDPLLDAKNQKKIISTTGHVSSLSEDQPFGDLITTTTTSIGTDGAFGGMGSPSGSFDGSSNVYNYRLESTPSPQHSSYACAVFYRGAVHLTPITGIHQFFPKPLVDRNLELSLGNESNTGGGGGIGGNNMMMGGQQQQNQQQQATSFGQAPRVLPRSIAMAKASENTRKIDFLPVEHPDSIPIAQRLMYSSYLQQQQQHDGSSDQMSKFQPLPAGAVEVTRTAADMARSSSDPARDEEEMMWGLQSFFPFIESTTVEKRGGAGGSSAAVAALAANNKQNIALKFAQQAMGVDEQVATIVNGGKLASCEDLQNHVCLPNSREPVSIPRLVQALLRCSVCVQGVWCCFWDPACSGIGAFVREFLLYTFAVADNEENVKNHNGSVSAREIFDLCGLNDECHSNENVCHSNLRKTIRTILPMLAALDPVTKRWSLKNYKSGKHINALKRASKDTKTEYENQLNGWIKRKDQVLANMRALARGEVPQKNQLALRAVYAAAVRGHMAQQQAALQAAAAAARGAGAPGAPSASQQQQNIRMAMRADEMERCRRFVRNAFEMNGVINKGLFRERILQMSRTRESTICGLQKDVLQDTLREELQGFTDSTWILKTPCDPTTVALRPYVLKAILAKSSFTTKEIEQAAFQLVHEDPNQTVLGGGGTSSGTSSASSSVDRSGHQRTNSNEKISSTQNQNDDAASSGNNTNSKQHHHISSEHHAICVRVINELAQFSKGEKKWHVKTGIVQFLAIS